MAVTTDYTTGGVALLDSEGGVSFGPDLVNSDAVARAHAGLVYVVNRRGSEGNNIQVLDPDQNCETVAQFGTGPDTNPQDIAVLDPSRAYIALFDTDYLLVANPLTGEEIKRIDLSHWAADDPDGMPETSSVLLVGNTLFVAIERLDRTSQTRVYPPIGDSYLVKIDAQTDLEMGYIRLQKTNPFGPLQLSSDGRHILVVEPGAFDDPADGGVEWVDAQGSEPSVLLAEEGQLGANLITAAYSGARLVVVLGEETPDGQATSIVELVPGSGTLMRVLYAPESWVVSDLKFASESVIWATDRTVNAPGIRRFDLKAEAGDEELAFWPFGGLAPYQILLAPF